MPIPHLPMFHTDVFSSCQGILPLKLGVVCFNDIIFYTEFMDEQIQNIKVAGTGSAACKTCPQILNFQFLYIITLEF